MEINPNPPATAHGELQIAADPQKVFAVSSAIDHRSQDATGREEATGPPNSRDPAARAHLPVREQPTARI